jgi:hypothetical protein
VPELSEWLKKKVLILNMLSCCFALLNNGTKIVLQLLNQQTCQGINYYFRTMRNFPVTKIVLLTILFCITISACEAQKYKRSIRNPERALFGKSLNTKDVKYREAPSIVKAKKKQAANKEKIKKEYAVTVKENRKRAIKIQSPEVKERMIDNRKQSDLNYKNKKKKMEKSSRRTGKKYK